MTVDSEILAALAPEGRLRASLNMGNPLLTNRNALGVAGGVTVDLSRKLARRLGVEVEFLEFDTAAKSVASVEEERADVAYFAIDPARAEKIAFTAPYALIEGWYAVRNESPIVTNAQVDVPGNRVVVGAGSAYDLFLTRELKRAEIVRTPLSETVVDEFLAGGYEVAAGVKQQIAMGVERVGGMRLLNERFMVIRQAMVVPKSRGEAAATYLRAFIEEMKASGFIADAIARHRADGAIVAPAE